MKVDVIEFLEDIYEDDNGLEWKKIKTNSGEKELYVSRKGDIESNGTLRKLVNNGGGYYKVIIRVKSERCSCFVHRLVAQAFIPNPDNLPEVNHIDGDKGNNCVSNLEWVTKTENIRHAFKTDLMDASKISCERSSSTDKTNEEIHEICKDIQDGMKNSEICEKYDVPKQFVSKIKNRLTWKEVSKNYKWKKEAPNVLLTEEIVHEICKMLEEKVTEKVISNRFNISRGAVNGIKRGENWEEISKQYTFIKTEPKVTETQVHEICQMILEHIQLKEISEILNISKYIVQDISRGKTWKKISCQYF